jgi:hypothetical protein
MNNKFAQSTDTSRHYNLLADDNKMRPNLLNTDEPNISMTQNNDIDSPDSINIDSDLELNNSEPELNQEEMEDFNKKKKLHNMKAQINRDYNYSKERVGSDSDTSIGSRRSSRSSRSNKSHRSHKSKKERIDLKKINDMDEIPFHLLDEKTKKRRKMEKYMQLLVIKNSGIKLSREYDFESDYEDMCFEVDFWNKHQKKKNGIQIGKSFMLNGIQGIEFLNEKYDPFGARLKGWHDHTQITSDSYDSVFGELYEKYNMSNSKMMPEIKLLIMIITGAASFHAAAKMAEKMPVIDTILKKDPNFLANLQKKLNGGITGSGEEKKESDDEKNRKLYETMQKLKEQKLKFQELEKKQKEVMSNAEKASNEMKKKMKEMERQNNKPSINNVINRIKAQNLMRKTENVVNEDTVLNDSDSSSSNTRNNDSDTVSGSITLNSQNKPVRRRKRKSKPTVSITT